MMKIYARSGLVFFSARRNPEIGNLFSLSAVNPDRTIRKSLMKGEFSTEITSYYYHSQRVSRAVGTHLPVAVRKPGWPSKSKVPFYGGAKVV